MAETTYPDNDKDRDYFNAIIAEAMNVPSLETFPEKLELGEDKEEELTRFEEYE